MGTDVLIVGSAVPMAWPRPTALALAAMGYRVTNFDYGEAEDPASSQARTCIDQIEDVLDVMDALGIERASTIGLSRGAIAS